MRFLWLSLIHRFLDVHYVLMPSDTAQQVSHRCPQKHLEGVQGQYMPFPLHELDLVVRYTWADLREVGPSPPHESVP